MKTVKTYLIYYKRDEYNNDTIYFQALSAMQAVNALGIPHEDVIEVAVVLKDWKRSK